MKTAVITGGNSGMGKATAIALAKKGYKIIINGRNANKTQLAAEEIKLKTANKNVDAIAADISSIKGMKEVAFRIANKTDSVEALVLSSGVILPRHVLTADGLEGGFAIQYLSRFAITQFLMPQLKKGNAKIAHVGAPILKNATIYFDDLPLNKNFTMMKGMGQCMLANHLFVQEFARRNPLNDVVMNLAYPGITKTGILRETNFFLRTLLNLFGSSPDSTAKNIIYLASDDAVNFSGYVLKKLRHPEVKESIRYDAAMAAKLWERSMELIQA